MVLGLDEPDGSLLVAEFSFRYKIKKEKFELDVARAAKRYFERIQGHQSCLPTGQTKP